MRKSTILAKELQTERNEKKNAVFIFSANCN